MAELRILTGDGSVLRALDDGPHDAPVLLLVHPGGSGPSVYDAVTAELARDLHVVRPWRRCYDPEATVPPGWDMHGEAADLLAVARLFDGPVHLYGHSSGAVAALEAALAGPDVFTQVIAYEPPMPTTDLVAGENGARAHAALRAGDGAEAMRIHLRDIAQIDPALVDHMFAHDAARAAFAAVAAAQLADNDALDALGLGIERYAGLDVPVTFIEGDKSPAHLRRRVAQLADVLPRARVLTLPGESHVAHLTGVPALAAGIREALSTSRTNL